jgi:hypothetical protein
VESAYPGPSDLLGSPVSKGKPKLFRNQCSLME